MSYINDALKKAQQDKDSLYGHYGGIISRLPGLPHRAHTKWMILSIVVLLVLAFFFLWLTFSVPPDRRVVMKAERPATSTATALQTVQPPTRRTLPPAAPVAPADKPAPAPPPVAQVAKAVPSAPVAKQPVISAPSLFREAQAAQRKGKTATAERLYLRVLTIDAGHVQAMNNLGVIYMSRNQRREAMDLFNKAIYLKKDYVDPYYNLACLHARQNNVTGSIQYLKAAMAINREVIDWVRYDGDLKNIRTSEEFRKLLENKGN